MEALLTNLILQDFGTYITFKFESNQVGNYILSKLLNNTYILDIPIPLDSNYYPTISGYLRAFEGTQEKAVHYVSISTTYNLNYDIITHNNLTGVWIEIHSSISSNGKNFSLSDGKI